MSERRPAPFYLGGSEPAVGGKKAVFLGVTLLLVGLTWLTRYDGGFRALAISDANDYAQMARQLYEGKGGTSLQTFPYVLGWLEAHGLRTTPPWPNVNRFPLVPLSTSWMFRLTGPTDLGAILPGALFLLASAVLVFLLGNRLFGPLAGLAAAVIACTSWTQVGYSVTGLTESGSGFFLLLCAYLLLRVCEAERRVAVHAFVLGVVFGLAFLYRHNLAAGAPVALLVLVAVRREARLVAAGAMLAGLGLSVLPWVVHCQSSFGVPMVSLTGERNLLIGALGYDPAYFLEQHDARSLYFERFGELLRANPFAWWPENWHRLFGKELLWLPLVFVLGLFGLRTARAWWLAAFTIASFAVVALFCTLTHNEVRFYVPFTALFLLLAVGGTLSLLRRLPPRLHLILPGLCLIALSSTLTPGLAMIGRDMPKEPLSQVSYEWIQDRVEPGVVVASGASWRIAWNCERPSVRFRGSVKQLERMDRELVSIGAVVLAGPRAEAFESGLAKSPLGALFHEAEELPNGMKLWLRKAGTISYPEAVVGR